ncbi:MAG: glycoside hydrolase family 5 protein [Firmicutes bacterium]|nr:glycoside hydrolase family 5 protein [Bacillota bacterium]
MKNKNFLIAASVMLICACAGTSKLPVLASNTFSAAESAAEMTSEAASEDVSEQEENVQKYDNAQDFVSSMGIGWNLGNSLDPVDCSWIIGDLAYETAWGNPKVKQELIHFIKSEGFDTIRIPVTWTNHVGPAPDYIIREDWLNRVQEIVDWCVEEDMYIILNMHHESGWITTASTDYDNMMEKYLAIWSQIADRFGEYSEKLIFESMNEIGFDDLGTEQGCELMNCMNNEFTELIRNSGQNNSERYLILAGY